MPARSILLSLTLCTLAACPSAPRGQPVEPTGGGTEPAEPGDGWDLVKSPAGVVVIVNRGDAHFTVEIPGAEVKLAEGAEGPTVVVDGQLVQVVVTPAESVLEGATRAGDEELLRRHVEWEAAFISRDVGKELTPRQEPCTAPAGRACLHWEVEIPSLGVGEGPEVRRNVFFTTVVKDFVVVLGSPVFADEDPQAAAARLAKAMETLETSDAFIDPRAVRARVRGE